MNASIDPNFIGLFFPVPIQQEIALRWARRLARVIGERVNDLRPETTLAEILDWAAESKVDPIDFAVVFEPELRGAFASFLDDPDDATFRQMVEHFAACFAP